MRKAILRQKAISDLKKPSEPETGKLLNDK